MSNLENIENNSHLETTGRLKEIEFEVLAIAQNIQMGIVSLGKLIFEAKKLCKDTNINYEDWCKSNIGLHWNNCNRFIRIWEVSRNVSTFASNYSLLDGHDSFRKLDALCMLAEPIKENKSYCGTGDKEVVVRNDDGSRKFDTAEVEKFLSEYPEFKELSILELRSIIKKRKEDIELLKKQEQLTDSLKKELEKHKDLSSEHIKNEVNKARQKALAEITDERKKMEMEVEFKKQDILLKLNTLKLEEEKLLKEKQEIAKKSALVSQKQNMLADLEKRITETTAEFNKITKEKESLYKQIDNMKAINKFITVARQFQGDLAAFTSNTDYLYLLREKTIRENVSTVLYDILDSTNRFLDASKSISNVIKADWCESNNA